METLLMSKLSGSDGSECTFAKHIDYSSSNSHPWKKNFSAETSFGKQK